MTTRAALPELPEIVETDPRRASYLALACKTNSQWVGQLLRTGQWDAQAEMVAADVRRAAKQFDLEAGTDKHGRLLNPADEPRKREILHALMLETIPPLWPRST